MSAQVGDVIAGQVAGLPDGTVLAPLPGAGHEVRLLIRGEWFAPTATGLFNPETPGRLVMDPWMFQQGERWVIAYIPGQPPRPERVVKAEALREAADAWTAGGWSDHLTQGWAEGGTRGALVLGMAQAASGWLLARADRIEATR